MIPIKLVSALVLATFSVAVSAQQLSLYPSDSKIEYEYRYDTSDDTILQIDHYVNDLSESDEMKPGRYGYEIMAMFAKARELLAHWKPGDKMCSPEQAKSLAPLVEKFLARYTRAGRSQLAEKSVLGWLANRLIECVDQYHEQYAKELQSIESIARLGHKITYNPEWLQNKPANFWQDHFFRYFTKSQDRVLKSRVLSSVGGDSLSKKFFDEVFDERITQQCARLNDAKEAVDYALVMRTALKLLENRSYPSSLRDLVHGHEACEKVKAMGRDNIRELTIDGYRG